MYNCMPYIVILSPFSGFTFYKMANLDNRISNADQLLTQDVEKFCDTLGELYSNICKVRVHGVLEYSGTPKACVDTLGV